MAAVYFSLVLRILFVISYIVWWTHVNSVDRVSLPEDDDGTVEDVESIRQVAKDTEGDEFEEHFQGKDARKYEITYLHRKSQLLGLCKKEDNNKSCC